jgi:uncharacterized peroxidase-related enzyme
MTTLSVQRARSGEPLPAHPEAPISRLSIPDVAAQPAEITQLFNKFRSHYGFVPNWALALSVNPGTALRMVAFYESLFDPLHSQLRDVDRELIAVVSSATNGCSYCVFNHTAALSRSISRSMPPRAGAVASPNTLVTPVRRKIRSLIHAPLTWQ